MAQIAMAWVMAKPGVSAPVVGSTNLANLEDIIGKSEPHFKRGIELLSDDILAGSLDVTLTKEEIQYLEEPYRPLPIIGHD